jgi:hypothetical protein
MSRLAFVNECPTCGSVDPDLRKLVQVPESGASDWLPVGLWDPCDSPWHSLSSLPLANLTNEI